MTTVIEDRTDTEQKLEAVGRAVLHVQGRPIDRVSALAAGAKQSAELYASYVASLGRRASIPETKHLVQAKADVTHRLELKAAEIQSRDNCDPSTALIRAAQACPELYDEFRAAMPRV